MEQFLECLEKIYRYTFNHENNRASEYSLIPTELKNIVSKIKYDIW